MKSSDNYHNKYLKYKSKYMSIKNSIDNDMVADYIISKLNNNLMLQFYYNLDGASNMIVPIMILWIWTIIHYPNPVLFGFWYQPEWIYNMITEFNRDVVTMSYYITNPSTNSLSIINAKCRIQIQWLNSFDIRYNIYKPFFFGKKIEMMQQITNCRYYEDAEIQAIEIFLYNTNYVVGILLPILNMDSELMNTPYYVPRYDMQTLMIIITKMELQNTHIFIPKIIDTKYTDLTSIIQKIGIKNLMGMNNISRKNFSIINHISVEFSNSDISINQTIHSETTNLMKRVDNYKIFNADHPFIYYIRHIPTNTFLFMGDYQG